MRDLERRTLDLVSQVSGRALVYGTAPPWLHRPGLMECGPMWPAVREIYERLTDGLLLPEEMPAREGRRVDGIVEGAQRQIIEIDESQHFNSYRTLTIDIYPRDAPLGFPPEVWSDAGRGRLPTAGGGWGMPKPPLFPMHGGRHRQRAFRDALADLLPPVHGFGPTIRIADFELRPWIWTDDAAPRMAKLLAGRLLI